MVIFYLYEKFNYLNEFNYDEKRDKVFSFEAMKKF